MIEKKKRILWIDGLRGVACLGIFLNHFSACFFEEYVNHPLIYPNSFITKLGQTPLAVFFNGSSFFVLVFCMITGMVAASSMLGKQGLDVLDQSKLSDSLIKRYLRLFLPVFVLNSFVFLLLRLEWMSNGAFSERVTSNWAGMLYYEYDPHSNLVTLLVDSFIRVPFEGSTKYCLAYWSLPHLFYGFFLAILLSQMSWGKTKHILLVYLLLATCLLIVRLDMTACFPLGVAIAFWSGKRKSHNSKKDMIMGTVLIVIGMFFGGFPIYSEPTGGYILLNHSILKIPAYMIWHYVGAGMTMVGLVLCEPVRNLLSFSFFQRLGKISFGLYLIHIAVITSVGTGLAVYLIDNSALQYFQICFIAFCAVTAAVLLFAWLFHHYIESSCEKISGFLVEKLKEKE